MLQDPSDTAPSKEMDNMSEPTFRSYVAYALKAGEERMSRMEEAISANSTQSKATHERTDEMVQMFEAMKGGLKVFAWIGNGLKWTAGVLGAVVVLAKAAGWKWPWN